MAKVRKVNPLARKVVYKGKPIVGKGKAPVKKKATVVKKKAPVKYKKVPVKTTKKVQKLGPDGKPIYSGGSPAVAASEGTYQRDLRDQSTKDKSEIEQDYAGRGMLRSGFYGARQSEYEKEFQKQLEELSFRKGSLYGDVASEERQFQRDQELQKEQARLEAARRKAAKSGSFI